MVGLQAFKKRNDDVRRKVQLLAEQPTAVDFSQYRAVLKNQAIVDEIEKRFNAFQPATYDLPRQLKAIEVFEVEAIKNAEATKDKVDLELKDLEKTLTNIETARPFEDLTVDEVAAAEPSIDEKTAKLVSKGRWSVPGYKVRCCCALDMRFGRRRRRRCQHADPVCRRDSATSPFFKLPLAARFPFFVVYSSIVDSLRAEEGPWPGGEFHILLNQPACPGSVVFSSSLPAPPTGAIGHGAKPHPPLRQRQLRPSASSAPWGFVT